MVVEMALLFGTLSLVVIFLGVFLNEPFWQGYRNSKFFDELKKEDDELLAEKQKSDEEAALWNRK